MVPHVCPAKKHARKFQPFDPAKQVNRENHIEAGNRREVTRGHPKRSEPLRPSRTREVPVNANASIDNRALVSAHLSTFVANHYRTASELEKLATVVAGFKAAAKSVSSKVCGADGNGYGTSRGYTLAAKDGKFVFGRYDFEIKGTRVEATFESLEAGIEHAEKFCAFYANDYQAPFVVFVAAA